jgi:hypothetical protein
MLQKFTQKTTYNYNQFSPLGKIYLVKGQYRPREIMGKDINNTKGFSLLLYQYESLKNRRDLKFEYKKTRRSGFLYTSKSKIK